MKQSSHQTFENPDVIGARRKLNDVTPSDFFDDAIDSNTMEDELAENKFMKSKRIRHLTESKLRNIIISSINQVLREGLNSF